MAMKIVVYMLYNAYLLPVFLYGAETWSITKAIEKRIDASDQWCLRPILNITWSEHVTNYKVHRRTGQPLLSDTVWTRRLKLFGHVARADKSQDYSRALQDCISSAPRSSKTHLAEDGGGRSAPIQSWTCVKAPKGTKEISFADTRWNSYVTDKSQLID